MSSKKIPIFTLGGINEPSKTFIPNEETIFVSSYTGQILDGQPTFGTPTGLPIGHKNQFFHGGVKNPILNVVICHQH